MHRFTAPPPRLLHRWNSHIARILPILGLLWAIATQAVQAQALTLKRYDAENGLAEGYVYSLNQDDKGFLYLGTGSGLFRFDGAHFRTFTIADGLADDFITAGYKDKKGRIWFGHEGRVSYLEGFKLHALRDTASFKSRIVAICEDSFGDIWCASQRNGLFQIDTDKAVLNISAGLEDGQTIQCLATSKIAGVEYILLGTDQGLLVYKLRGRGKLDFAYAATKVPTTKLQCIIKQVSKPGFWIGTEDEGLIAFTPGTDDEGSEATRHDATNGFAPTNVQSLYEDLSRNLWVGTGGQGFFKYRHLSLDDQLVPVLPSTRGDTIGDEIIKAIFQDKFGQTWMGTYGNGLICLSEQTFTTMRLAADSTTKLELLTAMEDSKGDIWIGTSRGIYVVDRETVAGTNFHYTLGSLLNLPFKKHYGPSEGLQGDAVTCMLEDPSHNIWVGTRDAGISVLMNGEPKFMAKPLSDLALSNNVNALTLDKDKKIWIATSDGAFSHDIATGKTDYYGTQNKLPHNNVYDIFTDNVGHIWFATHTNRIAVFDGKNIETIEVTSHGEIPNITCISQDKKGVYWLGTDGSGLYRYDRKTFKQYTKTDGLQSNYVYHLVIDHYGHVWTTHRDGFSRFVPDTEWFLTYPSKSYLPSEENPPNRATIDDFGNIWFCTEYGIMRYNWNPNRNKGIAPYTFIESVSVFDSLYPIDQEIRLPYDSYRITFRYLGLTFFQQEDVVYQFRLDGREPDWSPLTPQEVASFQALEDGEYTFHVRACNSQGKCNESSAKIHIVISPPFWKTWWFRALIVLAVGGIVFAYIRYRIYRLNKEKAALEEKVKQRTAELQLEKEKVEYANIELEKLSLVASETDNAVFILDASGKLTWVNDGFTRLTGMTMEELLAVRGFDNFLKTSSNPDVSEMLATALKENRSVQYESKLPSKFGRDIWVVSTLNPILDKEGKLRNIVIIDSNITDRKLAEEKIRQMNAELETQVAARTRELAEANQSLKVENQEHIKTAERLKVINSELDTFVYRASHDLKGPLASLNGLVNIASMELSDNPVATRYLGLMDKAAKRLDGILIDLIEATQVKQRVVEYTEIKALDFVNAIIDSLRSQYDFATVDLGIDIDPELKLRSDDVLLTSVTQNLVANALRYRDPKKEVCKVAFSIVQDAERFTIKVADNGLGIPDEAKHRVFDMFFKGSGQASGSGLGLYIVKQATDKLQGTVEMESTVGVGTTMTVQIPN